MVEKIKPPSIVSLSDKQYRKKPPVRFRKAKKRKDKKTAKEERIKKISKKLGSGL